MTDTRRKLPPTASFATAKAGGKLSAPSAVRNKEAIVRAITRYMPARGKALEIASGTGEHVVHFAAAFPGLIWQPTDVEATRLASIAAWSSGAGQGNILPPIALDASVNGWAETQGGQDVIILSNLLHLISAAEAATVVSEAARALASNGVLLIYGPFMRGSDFASEGDEQFHNSLTASAPEIGYKSFQDVQNQLGEAGLSPAAPIEMPASNLVLVAVKP